MVLIQRENRPVAMLTISGDVAFADLSKIATSIFADQNLEVNFLHLSPNEALVKEKFELLLSSEFSMAESKVKKPDNQSKEVKSKQVFSNREMEILQLIAMEYTNEQIADKLCLAKRTVDNHRVNLMQRANAKNTAGLIGFAFRNGLVV